MKSATFALVASLVPFAYASPYHMLQHAERDVDVVVDWVTDVQVVTAYAEVTQYWTGEPAVTTTSVTVSSTSTSETPSSTTEAYQRQHNGQYTGGRGGHYTIQKSTTEEPTSTSTSVYVAPTTSSTSTSVYVAPEPTTTSSTWVAPVVIPTSTWVAPVVYTTPTIVNTPTSSSVVSVAATSIAPLPTYTPSSNYVSSGDSSYDMDNMKPAILDSSNAWRWKWFADDLVWDDDQASQAQTQANTCIFSHTRVGQNIAAGYDSPTAANNAWGGEYTSFLNPASGGDDGHFTQLVWKESSKIGCAAVQCGASDPNKPWKTANGWYFVCNYDPIGNFANGNDPYPGSYKLNISSVARY